MNRLTLRFRKWWTAANDWTRQFSPKVELWIDKYKIIKVGCVLGIVLNGYYIYDGILDVIVLKEIKKEVENKKLLFYKRMEIRKEQILALMKELEAEQNAVDPAPRAQQLK